MSGRRPSNVRDLYFESAEGGRKRWKKYNWSCSNNATRMAEHVQKAHPGPPVQPWLDHSLTATEQLVVERKLSWFQVVASPWCTCPLLAFSQVQSGISLSSLETPAFAAFCKSLRVDFTPPSARTLGRHSEDLFLGMQDKVNERLRQWAAVHLAIDGWQDPQRTEIIAITASCATRPEEPTLLLRFERLGMRTTSENLHFILVVCAHSFSRAIFASLLCLRKLWSISNP